VREERAVLEDHADVTRLRLHPRPRAGHLARTDADRAGVGSLEAGDEP
jgi:hypothetical protein